MEKQLERRLQAIDVFSGCGGLTLGLKQAGFNVIAAIELDSKSARVYKENHLSTVLHIKDVRKISGKSLLDSCGLKRGDLDLLAGCPPCQGFSRIRHRNKGLVEDGRNALIDDFSRLVATMRPKSVMMENVEAIVGFEKFNNFLFTLSRCGYLVDSDEEQNSIGKLIKDAYGVEPLHVSDGHKEPAVSYVNWIHDRLRLLDAICPEYVMLEGLIGKEDAANIATSNQLAKKHLITEMKKRNHRTDASSLAAAASFVLHPGNPAYYHIEYIAKVLREFLTRDLGAD